MRCIVVSNNKKKRNELIAALTPFQLNVYSYSEVIKQEINIIENGSTFHENAAIKANALHYLKNDIILADDSGLEITALNGDPGIYSARYGGTHLTDLERCEYILKKCEGIKNRNAQFKCIIACKAPKKPLIYAEGKVQGSLSTHLKGENGFGYDPIFIPHGYTQTFAELGLRIKQKISHRAQAIQNLSLKIEQLLEETKK